MQMEATDAFDVQIASRSPCASCLPGGHRARSPTADGAPPDRARRARGAVLSWRRPALGFAQRHSRTIIASSDSRVRWRRSPRLLTDLEVSAVMLRRDAHRAVRRRVRPHARRWRLADGKPAGGRDHNHHGFSCLVSRRRSQGRHDLRRHRRVRLSRGGESRSRARFARHHAALVRLRSRRPHLPFRRPGFSPNGCPRESGPPNSGLTFRGGRKASRPSSRLQREFRRIPFTSRYKTACCSCG